MLSWLILAVQAAQASGFDLAALPARPSLSVIPRCAVGSVEEEVVVCADRRDRYRLPLPVERAPGDRAAGEPLDGTAALAGAGRCGIFAGERRCNKRDAAAFGYGNGRNPVSVLTRLARKVADPDGD